MGGQNSVCEFHHHYFAEFLFTSHHATEFARRGMGQAEEGLSMEKQEAAKRGGWIGRSFTPILTHPKFDTFRNGFVFFVSTRCYGCGWLYGETCSANK